MILVLVGVLLLACKVAELGPVAEWSWWLVLAPFGVAVLWWQFSDITGLTMKREIDKMEQRKVDRRDRALEALGLNHQREKQVAQAREVAAARRVSADPTQADRRTDDPAR